jgi:non-specific serine/threonine protein kinase/serine/threonine-protein kinase
VALKVIRPGYFSARAVRRFEHEAAVLARLRHPGIAQIYEAGTAAHALGARPFFAMELIEGEPLVEFARRRKLGTRARLELFAKVCEGVQHAHQKGVIHRDLKPGNILVDPSGQPKILDFGIARSTDADVLATTLATGIGQLIGTLSYMSPEQAAGDSRDLDTRSDVYALGVVLFELLTGRLPHDLAGKSIPEALRVISAHDPTRLSSLDKLFRGDLDTIVSKTLEKDRTRRYGSASALGADVRRYLADEPISARPDSTVYQLGKFAKRNKALVAGVCATMAVLAAGTVVSTRLYLRGERERRLVVVQMNRAVAAERLAEQRLAEERLARDAEASARARAERAAERAERTKSFLLHIYDSVDPLKGQGQDVTVRQVIDDEAQRLQGELDDEPEVKAELLETIGLVYRGLGAYDRSRELLTQSAALRRAALGEDDPLVADALLLRASVSMVSKDHYEDALADCQRALVIYRDVHGEDHEQSVMARAMRAGLLSQRGGYGTWDAMVAAAMPILLSVEEDDFPEPTRDVIAEVRELANAGDLDAAKARLWRFHVESTEELRRLWSRGEKEQALEQIRAHYAPLLEIAFLRPLVPAIVSGTAAWMHSQGEDPDAVEPLLREAVALTERVDGVPPTSAARVTVQLAEFLRDRGMDREAQEMFERALELNRKVKGEKHEDVAYDLSQLARLALQDGERARAEVLARQAAEIYRAVRPAEHPDVAAAERLVGECATSGK